MIKDSVSESDLNPKAMYRINAFILHQLATYYGNNNTQGLTPKDYLHHWITQTLYYLDDEGLEKAPPPEEYQQLIDLFPVNKKGVSHD